MKDYDVIVVGSGAGMLIIEEATEHGAKTALIDKGPFGGTCLNNGCIPSKMLIHPADQIVEMQEASKLGIRARVEEIDFLSIMERTRNAIEPEHKEGLRAARGSKEFDFYEGEGHFIDEYTFEVNGEKIRGKQIFLASGSRVFVPPIKGLADVEYLTSETLFNLNQSPQSLIIIGGGYIGVEYGHFFAAMGSKVTIMEMTDDLVAVEEPEIRALLKRKISERMDVITGSIAEEVIKRNDKVAVKIKKVRDSEESEIVAEKVLIAVGRRSNADLLKMEKTGVEVDQRGYIKVDDQLRTSKKNIWAVGDATGQQMFRHAANRAALYAFDNAFHNTGNKMEWNLVPHAVFTHPQIASVGLTEAQARKSSHQILVGRAAYMDVAKGEAMVETEGFAKAIVDKDSNELLGFHIVGPHAAMLIQEVVNAMSSGGDMQEIMQSIHIHPALPELITSTLTHLD